MVKTIHLIIHKTKHFFLWYCIIFNSEPTTGSIFKKNTKKLQKIWIYIFSQNIFFAIPDKDIFWFLYPKDWRLNLQPSCKKNCYSLIFRSHFISQIIIRFPHMLPPFVDAVVEAPTQKKRGVFSIVIILNIFALYEIYLIYHIILETFI